MPKPTTLRARSRRRFTCRLRGAQLDQRLAPYSSAAPTDALPQHVDAPEDRHRLVLLDERRLRCLDCSRTLAVALRPAASLARAL